MPMFATILALAAIALGHAAQNPDDAAVRLVVQHYVDAREARDPDALQKVFTSDADQLVSSGEWRRGREAVVKGGLASTQQSGGRRAIHVETVRFLARGVALVDARYELTGLQGGTSRSMWTTLVVVSGESGWHIAAIRNMLPAPPAPAATGR